MEERMKKRAKKKREENLAWASFNPFSLGCRPKRKSSTEAKNDAWASAPFCTGR